LGDESCIYTIFVGSYRNRMPIRFIWLGIESAVGPSEHGNKPSDSIRGGEYLDYMRRLISQEEFLSME
jgi:hypothetical protein